MVRGTNKVYKILNYAAHLPVLASIVTACVSISAFASLVSNLVGIDTITTVIKIL